MKHVLSLFICCAWFLNATAHESTQTQTSDAVDLWSEKQAIDVVAQLSEHIAALIIHHKNDINNPEITKEHSIEIVKKITAIIVACINNSKSRKTSRYLPLYSQKDLETMIEKITLEMLEAVEAQTAQA
jgi:hypothetical protein